jgi:TonB family protein
VKRLAVACALAIGSVAHAQPVTDADAYRAALATAFGEAWSPRDAVAGGDTGRDLGPFRVQLHVVISADGHVVDVTVRRSSGYAFFDDAAVVAVTLARPLVPPPQLLGSDHTLAINWWLGAPGWETPHYAGDALAATPVSPRGEAGAAFEVDSRTRALAGASTVARDGASYTRTALTATAQWTIHHLGILELAVPYTTVRYREPSSATTADLSGLGDISLHAHGWYRWPRFRVDGYAGFQLPTGATATPPILGRALPAIVELGSGRLRIDYGLCGAFVSRVVVGLCESYADNLGGTDNFAEPAVSDTRLYAALPVLCRHAQLFAAALYEHRDSAAFSIDSQAGTVTTTVGRVDELFGELGAWAVIYRGLAVRATVELPVYENVGGAQLADTIRALGSLSYDFDR